MRQGDRIQNGHQHNFFMIPNEMIDSHIENMTALGFVVYSVLMRHADAGSQCFPSYSTLERKSSLSRPTIAKCIEHLVTKGYIRKLEIGHSKGHATTYQLLDLSLVPTSKGDLPVNEINQSMGLTSKGDLLVTSKGDLPQLVNEVNSNNTHITKPINNNTHIKENAVFENSPDKNKSEYQDPTPLNPPAPPLRNYPQEMSDRFNTKTNRFAPKGLDLQGFSKWHLGGKRNNWDLDLIAVARVHLKKHEKPFGDGDAINFINAICMREDWAKFELFADEATVRHQKEQSQQQQSQQQPAAAPLELVVTAPPAHIRDKYKAS
jgi:hypothetical protein